MNIIMNKYSERQYNEGWDKQLAFIKRCILKEKIKKVSFGHNYHFAELLGPIRVFMSKRKYHNDKTIILEGRDWEIDCNQYVWKFIELNGNTIEVDEMGLYITFDINIEKKYLKELGETNGSKDSN